MAVDAPTDNVVPLGEGYGSDPYNEEAVTIAMATIREACAQKGHRCLIVVDPDEGPFFAGYIGSPEWIHFMAGRIMRMAIDDREDVFLQDLEDGAALDE